MYNRFGNVVDRATLQAKLNLNALRIYYVREEKGRRFDSRVDLIFSTKIRVIIKKTTEVFYAYLSYPASYSYSLSLIEYLSNRASFVFSLLLKHRLSR